MVGAAQLDTGQYRLATTVLCQNNIGRPAREDTLRVRRRFSMTNEEQARRSRIGVEHAISLSFDTRLLR